MRHLAWGAGFAVLNAAVVALNLAAGNVFFAGFVAALIPLSVAIVFLGWLSERRSGRRAAELSEFERAYMRRRAREEAERAMRNGG
jgi:hypothetical protein